MFDPLFLQRPNCGQRAEHGIAVISAAPTIQFAVAYYRCPGVQAVFPAGEFRLFVVVAVQDDNVVGRARNLDKQNRRSAFDPHYFDLHATDGLLLAPLLEQIDGFFHMAVLFPVGIEHGRFIGNLNIFANLWND